MANRSRVQLVLVVLALAGCDAAASGRRDAGAAGAAETVELQPLTVSFSGRVVSRVEGDSETPGPALAGAELCAHDHEGRIPCVTTDAEGAFRLEGLPFNSELAITLNADGFRPMVIPHVTGTGDIEFPLNTAFQMWPADVRDYDPAVRIDTKLAGILTWVTQNTWDAIPTFGAAIPSVGLELEPAAGDGPFFSTRHDLWEPGRTASTTDGHGLWVNLPIPEGGDTYRVRFVMPPNRPYDCFVGGRNGNLNAGGFPTDQVSDRELVLRAPVVSGHFTYVSATCIQSAVPTPTE